MPIISPSRCDQGPCHYTIEHLDYDCTIRLQCFPIELQCYVRMSGQRLNLPSFPMKYRCRQRKGV